MNSKKFHFNNSSPIFFLLFILLLALFIRLRYLFPYDMLADEAHYFWYAKRIHEDLSNMWSCAILRYHSPLFPFLLSFFYSFQNPELVSRIILILTNLMGVLGIYLVGLEIGGVFVGLFSAAALALNPAYIYSSNLIMADSPLVVSFIFFFFVILKINERSSVRDHFCLGAIGAISILLKWTGILLFPFIFSAYLFIFKDQPFRKKISKIALPMTPMTVTVAFLIVLNFLKIGSAIPSLSAIRGVIHTGPFWYYLLNFHDVFFVFILLPFFVYGLFLSFSRNSGKARILGFWFITFFLGISLIAEKQGRYALIALPSVLLLASLGVKIFLEKSLKGKNISIAKNICLVCFLFFSVHFVPKSMKTMGELVAGRSAGFKEACVWLNDHLPQEAVVMTSSMRLTRYYSRIEYQSSGGKIVFLPNSMDKFKISIKKEKVPIFLLIDRWKFVQPPWAYPVSEDVLRKLEELGFDLVKIIKRHGLKRKRGSDEEPVIWIFERKAGEKTVF